MSRAIHFPVTAFDPLMMLTGYGYEEERPYSCWVPECAVRFARDFNLVTHLELVHGWNIDDINDHLGARRDHFTGATQEMLLTEMTF